jgi:hypothetical protein
MMAMIWDGNSIAPLRILITIMTPKIAEQNAEKVRPNIELATSKKIPIGQDFMVFA